VTGELELIVSAVTGAMTGGIARPVLAPFTAVSEVWTDTIKSRLIRTAERATRKRQGDDWAISERTAVNALSAAALTDDDVLQEYLAGVVAAATLLNDNAHILALISRLTPLQLRLHYGLYLGAATFVRTQVDFTADHFTSWDEASRLGLSGEFVTLITDPGLPRGKEWDPAEKALDHLAREGLIEPLSSFWDESQQAVVAFRMTTFGMELFAAALGIELIAFGDFCEVHPDRLQLDPPIPAMDTRLYESFKIAYNEDRDRAWGILIATTAGESPSA
jgi:hypothetical protein